jgi:cobalamin biosynthesis protein CobT
MWRPAMKNYKNRVDGDAESDDDDDDDDDDANSDDNNGDGDDDDDNEKAPERRSQRIRTKKEKKKQQGEERRHQQREEQKQQQQQSEGGEFLLINTASEPLKNSGMSKVLSKLWKTTFGRSGTTITILCYWKATFDALLSKSAEQRELLASADKHSLKCAKTFYEKIIKLLDAIRAKEAFKQLYNVRRLRSRSGSNPWI